MECKCPHCNETIEIDDDLENEDNWVCQECGQVSYYWVSRLVNQDDLFEYRCDSLASADYEDRAYGRDYQDE